MDACFQHRENRITPEFDLYLEEYASLGEHIWGQPRERAEDRGRKRPHVTVEQYPLREIPYRELLRADPRHLTARPDKPLTSRPSPHTLPHTFLARVSFRVQGGG
jgi:hypothetical protein